MTWAEFAAGAPAIAAQWTGQVGQSGVVIVGTLRRDGAPRLSFAEPCLVDGQLYLGMMWRSRKAVDLLRDPRIALHNAICTNAGDESELSLRGRAIAIGDPEPRRRFVDAVAARTTWHEPRFHLFAIDVESAAWVKYERGEQVVQLWPQGIAFRRPYG